MYTGRSLVLWGEGIAQFVGSHEWPSAVMSRAFLGRKELGHPIAGVRRVSVPNNLHGSVVGQVVGLGE